MTDRFSFRRLSRVAAYYWPELRCQAAVYASVSLLLGLLAIGLAGSFVPVYLLTAAAFSLMLAFGPIALATHSRAAVSVALPATGGEKAAFILGYVFVGLPLAVTLPYALCMVAGFPLIEAAHPDMALFAKMAGTYVWACAPYHLLAQGVLMAVCLLVVSAGSYRSAIRPVLAVLGMWLLLGLSSAAGFIVSMQRLFEQRVIGHSVYSVDSDANLYRDVTALVRNHPDCFGRTSAYGMAEIVVLAAVLAVLLVLITRTVKNRQI